LFSSTDLGACESANKTVDQLFYHYIRLYEAKAHKPIEKYYHFDLKVEIHSHRILEKRPNVFYNAQQQIVSCFIDSNLLIFQGRNASMRIETGQLERYFTASILHNRKRGANGDNQ
jgi:hypothetical protein